MTPSEHLQRGATAEPNLDAVRTPAKVKGTLLIARMKFLRGQGQIPVDAVLERLCPADRELFQGILLPSTWFPNDLLVRLETAMAAVIARGDRTRIFTEMGRFSAQANLGPGGVQRPYVREGNPHHLLERVPRMYLSQHTTGHRTYERTGPTSAVIRAQEADPGVSDDCQMVIGWLQRAIEISGGIDVRVVEARCRTRGDDRCEYSCSWM